jgi:hypothetical protein
MRFDIDANQALAAQANTQAQTRADWRAVLTQRDTQRTQRTQRVIHTVPTLAQRIVRLLAL